MKKLLFVAVLVISTFTSCTDKTETQNTESAETTESESIAKNVDVIEFKKLAEAGEGQILDVRTPEEVAEGYIKGANHIDIYDTEFKSKVAKLDKEKPVYVYCKSGGRSGKAMGEMKTMGFKTIYNLDGGIGAWNAAGNETVK